jgi:hypothetical protein
MTWRNILTQITIPNGHTIITESGTYVIPEKSAPQTLIVGAAVIGLTTSCM